MMHVYSFYNIGFFEMLFVECEIEFFSKKCKFFLMNFRRFHRPYCPASSYKYI